MIVEVIAVGTELLLGQIANTNAAYLGRRLAEMGIDAHYQVVVGDNLDRMVSTLQTAVGRADAVVVSGGLGPTQDDITREAISAAAGKRMLFSEERAAELRSFWEQLGREFPESNLSQAEYPEGAEQLANRWGTAPGLFLEHRGASIFALPGVPAEMRRMFEEHAAPRLQKGGGSGGVLVSRVLRIWGHGESAVASMLDDLYHASANPSMAFLASEGEVKVRLSAKAESEAAARRLIAPVEQEVRRRLGSSVFAADGQTLEGILLDELRARGWTIGAAESLTAGMAAARLTRLPGSSDVFRGAVAPYSADLKSSLLGVPPEVIETCGEVSRETAAAMAEGAARVLGVDAALALTGAAGPSALEHPPGSVAVAVRTPERTQAKFLRMPGDRERVRAFTVASALQLTRLAVIGERWGE